MPPDALRLNLRLVSLKEVKHVDIAIKLVSSEEGWGDANSLPTLNESKVNLPPFSYYPELPLRSGFNFSQPS